MPPENKQNGDSPNRPPARGSWLKRNKLLAALLGGGGLLLLVTHRGHQANTGDITSSDGTASGAAADGQHVQLVPVSTSPAEQAGDFNPPSGSPSPDPSQMGGVTTPTVGGDLNSPLAGLSIGELQTLHDLFTVAPAVAPAVTANVSSGKKPPGHPGHKPPHRGEGGGHIGHSPPRRPPRAAPVKHTQAPPARRRNPTPRSAPRPVQRVAARIPRTRRR